MDLVAKMEELVKQLNETVVNLEVQLFRTKNNAESLQRDLDRNSGALSVLAQL